MEFIMKRPPCSREKVQIHRWRGPDYRAEVANRMIIQETIIVQINFSQSFLFLTKEGTQLLPTRSGQKKEMADNNGADSCWNY